MNHHNDNSNSDNIDPKTLLNWYHSILREMKVPAQIRSHIGQFDVGHIMNLLVNGVDSITDPRRQFIFDEIPADIAPKLKQALRPIIARLHSLICNWPGWRQEQGNDIPLNDRQYAALQKGSEPSWEHRYATYHWRGNYYFYRSGIILMKFRYKKGDDGLWHVIKKYSSLKARDISSDFLGFAFSESLWDVPMLPRDYRFYV